MHGWILAERLSLRTDRATDLGFPKGIRERNGLVAGLRLPPTRGAAMRFGSIQGSKSWSVSKTDCAIVEWLDATYFWALG
jgi:hypothetical protein